MDFFPEEGVRTMLDVGCASGAFGLPLRNERGIEIWGIEMNAEIAELAKQRLDKVFVGDAMEILPTLPDRHFDLVVFNDILEHLPWPERALEEAKRTLAEGGGLLASLPNFRYWETFKHVMFHADFRYEASGVMDRTHLRFYTEKSIRRFFDESGFEIVKFKGIHPTLSRKLRLLNLISGGRFQDAKYLQYVIYAQLKRGG